MSQRYRKHTQKIMKKCWVGDLHSSGDRLCPQYSEFFSSQKPVSVLQASLVPCPESFGFFPGSYMYLLLFWGCLSCPSPPGPFLFMVETLHSVTPEGLSIYLSKQRATAAWSHTHFCPHLTVASCGLGLDAFASSHGLWAQTAHSRSRPASAPH